MKKVKSPPKKNPPKVVEQAKKVDDKTFSGLPVAVVALRRSKSRNKNHQ